MHNGCWYIICNSSCFKLQPLFLYVFAWTWSNQDNILCSFSSRPTYFFKFLISSHLDYCKFFWVLLFFLTQFYGFALQVECWLFGFESFLPLLKLLHWPISYLSFSSILLILCSNHLNCPFFLQSLLILQYHEHPTVPTWPSDIYNFKKCLMFFKHLWLCILSVIYHRLIPSKNLLYLG